MRIWHLHRVRSLLVASAGGHLEELWLLRPRLTGIGDEVTWVTWDTPQSRSLLVGADRVFVRRAKPRDPRTTLANARHALQLLARGEWDCVVSTGSLPAVPFLTVARALGIPCHFIESAARVEDLSLAARILERVPGVRRYVQHEAVARGSWTYRGSVFDGFSAVTAPSGPLRRVVVTVGANGFDFRRMIAACRRALPGSAQVLWQTGNSDVGDLGIRTRQHLRPEELREAMEDADLVIAHAGVGSALAALQSGHRPILIPRRRAFGEHVDDHQAELAHRLAVRGLAIACEADALTPAVIEEGLSARVIPQEDPAPFVLD